jgi:transcriptional regulator with XRE-family HTH domain
MNKYYFSANMKRRRIELGLTQSDLANMLGISQNTISEYETDVRYPTVDKVYDIANALQTMPETLMSKDMYQEVAKHKRISFL